MSKQGSGSIRNKKELLVFFVYQLCVSHVKTVFEEKAGLEWRQ